MTTPTRPIGPTQSPTSPPPSSPTRQWAWLATLLSGVVTVIEYLDSQQVLSFISRLGPNGPKYAALIAAVAGLVTVWAGTKHTDQSSAS